VKELRYREGKYLPKVTEPISARVIGLRIWGVKHQVGLPGPTMQ
jgi:hypothetical protein